MRRLGWTQSESSSRSTSRPVLVGQGHHDFDPGIAALTFRIPEVAVSDRKRGEVKEFRIPDFPSFSCRDRSTLISVV